MPVVPACLNYSDNADPDLGKYEVITAGRISALSRPHYREHQQDGRRIVQYVNWVDIGWQGGPFDQRFEPSDAPVIRKADGTYLSNWGGFRLVDMGNAAHRSRLVEAAKWALSQEAIDDLFCDVFGERLWTTSGWGAMTASQQAAFKAGQTDYAYRLGEVRDQYRPGARLYGNGTWAKGHPALVPVIEHHDGEIPKDAEGYWWKYLALPWDTSGQAAGYVIASTVTAGAQWAKIPGVGVVACQTDYAAAPTSALPMAKLTPRKGTTPPPPPPPSGPNVLPVVPAGLTVTQGAPGSGVLMADWADSPAAEQVDGYVLYLDDEPVRDPETARITESMFTLTGLTPGKPVSVRVSAHNAKGHGPWTDPAILVTPAVIPPPPPSEPSDPCAAVKSALAAAKAQADDYRDKWDAALAERNAARAQVQQISVGVATAASEFATKLADVLDG